MSTVSTTPGSKSKRYERRTAADTARGGCGRVWAARADERCGAQGGAYGPAARQAAEQQRARLLQLQRSQQMLVSPEVRARPVRGLPIVSLLENFTTSIVFLFHLNVCLGQFNFYAKVTLTLIHFQ